MDFKKLSIATLLGGITYFLLGWLVYGLFVNDLMALPQEFASVMYSEAEMKIGLMAASCLVWGFLITYILQKWAGISTFSSGFIAGATIGALVSLTVGLSMASMYKFGNIQNILIDTVANGIISGITGGVIGWWLSRGK